MRLSFSVLMISEEVIITETWVLIRDLREFTFGWNNFDQLPELISNMPNSAFSLVKVGSSRGLVKISAS